jgi:hypothetical protein
MSAVSVYFGPDLDPSWEVNPGVCTSMNMLAPLQGGPYGSVGGFTSIFTPSSALTGTDAIHAQTFRQVDGTVRFLVFRKENIDEYTSAGVRTNQGTGYSASTTLWNAAQWGNQIIAVNKLDAPQSSTGGAFSALSGSPPKASRIAANLNFVMMADVDDGGSNVYSDMVWWSALQNPNDWTPSLATQAGRIRLLDAAGPIRALVAYRDMFVAFKENAIFVGRYQGPFIFEWTMVSSRIGCVGSKAVVELDGKLYFAHWSGFYEFDGQAIRNVGLPTFKAWMKEGNYVSSYWIDDIGTSAATYTATTIQFTKLVADDVDGVVWFCSTLTRTLDGVHFMKMYGYNARTGRWGRAFFTPNAATSGGSPMIPITTNYADMQAFNAQPDYRVWLVYQQTTTSPGGIAIGLAYPYAPGSASVAQPSLKTGMYKLSKGSSSTTRIKLRHLYGSTVPISSSLVGGVVGGYSSEDRYLITSGPQTFTANAEFCSLDGTCDSPYQQATITYANNPLVILGGLDINSVETGKR